MGRPVLAFTAAIMGPEGTILIASFTFTQGNVLVLAGLVGVAAAVETWVATNIC